MENYQQAAASQAIGTSFLQIMGQMLAIKEKVRYFGIDQPLHKSEIHMVKTIAEHPDCYVTQLAELLGVTKGAVSQIVGKLAKKGLLQKKADPANLSRSLLFLTRKGRRAYLCHEKMHRAYGQIFVRALCNASPAEKVFLERFLTDLQQGFAAFCRSDAPKDQKQ